MSPWQILGDVIGWVLLAALALFVIAFVIAVVAQLFKPRKRRFGSTKVLDSKDSRPSE